jgi:uncharacterized membrane protein
MFCSSTLIFSVGVSWQIHRLANFAYPAWYKVLNIQDNVTRYVPKNKFNKQDFSTTSTALHTEMFAAIAKQIHHDGQGLSEINYLNEKGEQKKLLTQNEIIHLTDVSHLINKLTLLWFINIIPLFIGSIVYYQNKIAQPEKYQRRQFLAITFIGGALSLVIFGFTDIFYFLHQVVFPNNHQWFFYYQDSLMSTLMKAPDLFAAIGATLSLLATILFIVFYRFIFGLKRGQLPLPKGRGL